MENQPMYQQPMYEQPNDSNMGNSKLFSVLAYFGILWLIGLLVAPEKNNPYVKCHVNNAIILCIVSFILGFIAGILSLVPVLGVIIGILTSLVTLAAMVYGIYMAATDKTFVWPVIGNIKIVK